MTEDDKNTNKYAHMYEMSPCMHTQLYMHILYVYISNRVSFIKNF